MHALNRSLAKVLQTTLMFASKLLATHFILHMRLSTNAINETSIMKYRCRFSKNYLCSMQEPSSYHKKLFFFIKTLQPIKILILHAHPHKFDAFKFSLSRISYAKRAKYKILWAIQNCVNHLSQCRILPCEAGNKVRTPVRIDTTDPGPVSLLLFMAVSIEFINLPLV